MSLLQTLQNRNQNKCELCSSENASEVYAVLPKTADNSDDCVLLCTTCHTQLQGGEQDVTHWRCLNDSMWSPTPAVQVLAYQQLYVLSQSGETWAQDQLDILYLDDELKAWAESGIAHLTQDDADTAIDSNGDTLKAGDNVYLIKDLPVKGAGFTAKQGTTVRGISLTNNPEHIEGRVNGQKIVILTKFVKKV